MSRRRAADQRGRLDFAPSKYWDRRDWKAYHEEVRDRSINAVPPQPEPAHLLGAFSMFPEKEKQRQAEEQSRSVDRFLEAMGVRPKRRARE